MQASLASGRSYSARSSRSAKDSKRSHIGCEDVVVPPIFLGAAQKSSRFDSELEDDFDGADQTLLFDTERLRIFPEEYDMLKNMSDNPDRILAK